MNKKLIGPIIVFFFIFISMFIGGLIGIGISIKSLSNVNETVKNRDNYTHATVDKVVRKYKPGENNVYFKLDNENIVEKITLAKITTFFIEEGDSVQIIKDDRTGKIIVLELIGKIRFTYYVRLILFSVCVVLSIIVWKAFYAMLKDAIKDC